MCNTLCSAEPISLHRLNIAVCVCVCVEYGWFKQPHLAESDGLWGWLRLHTCCILSNQWAQVKPAISTHTREFSWMAVEHPCYVHYQTVANKPDFHQLKPASYVRRSQEKSPRRRLGATECVARMVLCYKERMQACLHSRSYYGFIKIIFSTIP